MGFKQRVLGFYAWLRRIHESYKQWVAQREEKTQLKREKEVEMLTRQAEALEAQLGTMRLENQVSEERRRLRNA